MNGWQPIETAPHEDEWVLVYYGGAAVEMINGKPFLKSADGRCIFLEPGTGCTVHDHKPRQCQAFDCRSLAYQWQKLNRAERREIRRKCGETVDRIMEAGKARMNETLDKRRDTE